MSATHESLVEALAQIPCRPIVVASHPRSGTHLCIDTLRLNFGPCHTWKYPLERSTKLYCSIDELGVEGRVQEETILSIIKRVERPVIKSHAMPGLRTVPMFPFGSFDLDAGLADWTWENSRIVYMYRDGREVMRSFHLFFATETDHPQSFSDFLRTKIDGRSHARLWADHVQSWLAEDRALSVSMESLLARPADTIVQIARHADLPVPATAKLPPRCDKDLAGRLLRRAGMHPTSSAVSSRYSSDPTPHWTDVFSPADREFFHQEAGHVLVRLGYEKSDNWVGSHSHEAPAKPLVFSAPHADNTSVGL